MGLCSDAHKRTSCFTSVGTIGRRPRPCAKPKPRPWRSREAKRLLKAAEKRSP
jgi:hypothetical protein